MKGIGKGRGPEAKKVASFYFLLARFFALFCFHFLFIIQLSPRHTQIAVPPSHRLLPLVGLDDRRDELEQEPGQP